MTADFFAFFAYALAVLICLLFAHVGVEMKQRDGKPAWKACGGTLALTGILGVFLGGSILELPDATYFPKLLALLTIQALAFVYFNAASRKASATHHKTHHKTDL